MNARASSRSKAQIESEELQRLDELSTEIGARIAGHSMQFKNPVISKPRDPMSLCKILSEKFKNFKMSIHFEGGNQAIYIMPHFTAFKLVSESSNRQYAIQELEKISQNFDLHYPSFQVISSYALGYDDASSKISSLQEDNRKLRDDIEYMNKSMRHYFPFRSPFGPGF